MDVGFSRIQFTPDLMPSDVIGTTIFDMQKAEFSFSQGPVFSNFILIDEINRSPAKTQAALFRSNGGISGHRGWKYLSNGLSFSSSLLLKIQLSRKERTSLPEAQLDRFLMKDQPDVSDPLQEEKGYSYSDLEMISKLINGLVLGLCLIGQEQIKDVRQLIEQVYISDEQLNYIANIIHNTRNNGDLFLGASPRASLAILKTSKAFAAINGRDFVIPEDIKSVAYPVLNHQGNTDAGTRNGRV